MTPQAIEDLFTGSGGQYLCARWERPIVPVVFGVEEETLAVVKGACEAVVALAGHRMAETDPEMGANLMVFFFRDWAELLELPDLDRLVPGLPDMIDRLVAADATRYQVLRFEPSGAIRACFLFLRIDAALAQFAAEDLALGQMAQAILTWSDGAFRERSPLALTAAGQTVLHPDVAAIIRAAYDPAMPAVAEDASHALRLHARIQPPSG